MRTHLGLDRRAARKRAAELLALVGIPSPEARLDDYPDDVLAVRVAWLVLVTSLIHDINLLRGVLGVDRRDALLVNQISFYDDPVRFTAKIGELCDELEERVRRGEGVVPEGTPRLLLSGCPMAVPNWKLPFVLESSGAVVVAEESCIGARNTRDLVSEDGRTLDELIDRIVDRYLKIDCACFTPNTERIDHVVGMARALKVDGVVHYGLQFCQPYAIESFKIERALRSAGIALLKIETDYGMEDAEILKNRVQAFVEMIR